MQLFNKPIINYFRAERLEVIADEAVMFEWETDNARSVTLDGIEVERNGSYSIWADRSRTVELIAHNRMGGTAAEYLFIQLLTPIITRFEARETTIKENEPMEVSFELRNCLSWKLMIDYGATGSGEKEMLAEGKIEKPRELFSKILSIQFKGSGELMLQARNGSETHSDYFRLHYRRTEVSLSTNQTVVVQGSEIHITWQAKHANKIILNPGNIDVTTLTHYDLMVDAEDDLQLEIKALGDFGQQVSDSKTLFLARLNRVYTSNNGDPANPLFYLNWSGTGFRSVTLLPDGILVQENETNYPIPASTNPVSYTLVGKTHSAQEVRKHIELNPCTIQWFQLREGMAIVGIMATLAWETKHATETRLTFSDPPTMVEIPITDLKHSFQVLPGQNKVRLTAWGNTNVVEIEIPIRAFQSPQISSLLIPKIDLKLGIRWIPPPPVRTSTKTYQLFSLLNKRTLRHDRIYDRIVRYISCLSDWLLNRQKAVLITVKKKTAHMRAGGIVQKMALLPWMVWAKLTEALTKKTIPDGQENFS